MISYIYIWNRNSATNKLIYKTEIKLLMQKTNYGYQTGGWGGINWD